MEREKEEKKRNYPKKDKVNLWGKKEGKSMAIKQKII